MLSALGVLVIVYGVYPQSITRYFEPEVTALAQPYQRLNQTATLPKAAHPEFFLTATTTGAHK